MKSPEEQKEEVERFVKQLVDLIRAVYHNSGPYADSQTELDQEQEEQNLAAFLLKK